MNSWFNNIVDTTKNFAQNSMDQAKDLAQNSVNEAKDKIILGTKHAIQNAAGDYLSVNLDASNTK